MKHRHRRTDDVLRHCHTSEQWQDELEEGTRWGTRPLVPVSKFTTDTGVKSGREHKSVNR